MAYQFTSESVAQGHPDKIADIISDAIVDEALRQDPDSRCGVDVLVNKNTVVLSGEITTKANIDYLNLVRQVIRDIGFKEEHRFNDQCQVHCLIGEQWPEIASGVFGGEEQGAGDQGMMFGYATDETPELMPLAIMASHKLLLRLKDLRTTGELSYLRPDAKSQVTVEYDDGMPKRVTNVVISTQHDPIDLDVLRKDVMEKCIKPVLGDLVDGTTKFMVNPAGTFIIGGPVADAGLTGRKIIVDTYGGMGRHGGGAFSGKDASKVDRSAAYAARYAAKNIVAAGLAKRCEVQLSYAIGVAEPCSLYVNCFGTNTIAEARIEGLVRKHFALKPKQMIETLGLKRPIYRQTASYGHFGREEFPWEKTDKAELLREEAKKKV